MKPLINPKIVLDTIMDELSTELGDNFKFTLEGDMDNNFIRPDIKIVDSKTGAVTIIEIKGSQAEDDLPLAIVPSMKRLKQQLEQKQKNNVVLVSLSDVSKNINEALQRDDIKVVKVDEDKGYIKKLSTIINKA